MKQSFKDASAAAQVPIDVPVTESPATAADVDQPAVPAPQSNAMVPAEQKSQIVPDSFFQNNEMEGEFDRSDIQLPRLSLVHGIGPLSETFQPGHLVYAKELDLGVGPVNITLVRLRKYFQEEIEWGSEDIPRICNSIEEIRKLGAYLTSEKKEMGEGHTFFKPVLDAQILIKGEASNTMFPFEFEGSPYALALMTMHGVAYTRTGKQFITASQFGLRNGLTVASWNITTKREKFGQNFVWFPVARQATRNSPEFIAWVKELTQA